MVKMSNFFKLSGVLSSANCLTNIPPNQPYDLYENPGLFWTADDQCKMFYGPTASFCHVNLFHISHFFQSKELSLLTCQIS